jgi:hypothetical protein
MMLRKTTIAISAALVLGAASTAFALEGRDGDNNSFPSGRGQVTRGAPAFVNGNVFAGPRFVAKRPAKVHARHRSY